MGIWKTTTQIMIFCSCFCTVSFYETHSCKLLSWLQLWLRCWRQTEGTLLYTKFLSNVKLQNLWKCSYFHVLFSCLQNNGKEKRSKKGDTNDGEKPREVVHVRARRGQATDSHSVAERVRNFDLKNINLDLFFSFTNVFMEIQTLLLFSNR